MAVQGAAANRGLITFNPQAGISSNSSSAWAAPTIGTDLSIQCENLELELIGEPDIMVEDEFDAVPGGGAPLYGRRGWRVTGTTKLRSWGDTTSATNTAGHELVPLFGGAPMKIVQSVGSDGDDLTLDPIATYNIDATDTDLIAPFSCLVDHENGNGYKIRDCVGIVSRIYAEEAGAPIKLDFEIRGQWEATPAATGTTLTAAKFSTEPILMNKAMALVEQIATGSPVALGAWEFIPGHTIEDMPDATFTNGMGIAYVGHSGNARLNLNINAVGEDVLAVFTEWLGRDGGAWSLATSATGTDPHYMKVAITNGYLLKPEFGTGNGVRKWDLSVAGRSTVTSGVPAVDHYQITFS